MANILILGGGFGGLAVARELSRQRKALPKGTNITLVNRESYYLYVPLLYDIFSANPRTTTRELRPLCKRWGIEFLQDEVVEIDQRRSRVRLKRSTSLAFDVAVVALGSEVDFFGIPGMKQHAFSFKSLVDAEVLKAQLDREMLEVAKTAGRGADPRLRVTIVGGGPTGVELAFLIREYFDRTLTALGISGREEVIIVEAESRLLPMFPVRAGAVAAQILRRHGIVVLTDRMVKEEHSRKLLLKPDRSIRSETVIWTGGVCCDTTGSLVDQAEHNHANRVAVTPTLQSAVGSRLFVLGDVAATAAPQTAVVALQQAPIVAANLISLLSGRAPSRTFVPSVVPVLIPLGNRGLFIYGKRVLVGRIPLWMRAFADWNYLRKLH